MNPIYALTTLVIGNNRIERTALNKLMFFAEALHIIEHDKRISDVPYLKCEYGPVPEDMRMIRARLVNSEWIAEEAKDNGLIIQFFYTATEKGLKWMPRCVAIPQTPTMLVLALQTRAYVVKNRPSLTLQVSRCLLFGL